MDSQNRELLRIYMDMLDSPLMRWMTWISIAIVMVVAVIAWKKGLSVWKWFLYALFLGPIALVHILFKPGHGPAESSGAL
jgi:hypothetical protein